MKTSFSLWAKLWAVFSRHQTSGECYAVLRKSLTSLVNTSEQLNFEFPLCNPLSLNFHHVNDDIFLPSRKHKKFFHLHTYWNVTCEALLHSYIFREWYNVGRNGMEFTINDGLRSRKKQLKLHANKGLQMFSFQDTSHYNQSTVSFGYVWMFYFVPQVLCIYAQSP